VQKGIKKILRKAFKGADISQIQFPFFVARNPVRVANKMNIPVMGACHIQTQNMTGAMGKDNKILDWMIESLFNFELFNRVDAIHCPSEFAAELIKSKASNSHLRVIIGIIRYISDEEKHPFLNTADMYLHSSGVELESLSCLEAMGCGLPCIIEDSPKSAASQFAFDERLDFKTVDELTSKIDYWYENRALLPEMKDRTLKFAENYRMEKSIIAMEQLYSDVIETHDGTVGLLPKEL